MMKFSAPRLLRLALVGSHLPYCPHGNDKTPGYECLCWKTEVRKWDQKAKLSAKTRVRKPKLQKIHLLTHKCSAKNPIHTSSVIADLTCQQCLKWANKPPRPAKKSKKNTSTNNLTTS
jgi:hypothetical protein